MGWTIVAAAAIAAYSAYQQNKSNRDALDSANSQQANAANSASSIAAANLDFQKGQLDYWKEIYGDTQQNLSDYFENLNASSIVSRSLQQHQLSYQKTQKQIQTDLAQRNIGGGKFEAYLQGQNTAQHNTNVANIKSSAPDIAAQAKQGFLSLGLGQYQNHLGSINSASGAAGSIFQNQAGLAQNRYGQAFGANNALNTNILNTGLGIVGLGAYDAIYPEQSYGQTPGQTPRGTHPRATGDIN